MSSQIFRWTSKHHIAGLSDKLFKTLEIQNLTICPLFESVVVSHAGDGVTIIWNPTPA